MVVRAGGTSLTVAIIPSAEKAAMLRDAVAWVASLGRDLTNTRFGRYLAELNRYAQDLAAGKPPDNSPLFYAASADGYVLSHAYQQLRGRYEQYVARRIDRACRGSDTIVDEDGANNEGRNFCFELSLACWLVSSGLELHCDDQADIGGQIAGHYLIVECKRVRSDKKVEMRGKEAVQRLSERLAKPDHGNMVGAVAFDFTPIANPDGVMLQGPNVDPQKLSKIGLHLVQRFASAHARHWREWGHADVVAVFNRVHLTGADSEAPQDATLHQLTFQGMHRLFDDNSPHSRFLNDLSQVFSHRGAALRSAEQEARFDL
jgi:hypothetical protein